MAANDESPNVACALTASDHAARIVWIEELNGSALHSYQRDGSRIRLAYDPAAAGRVYEFVRRERKCCPFLRFATEEHHGAFFVIIDAPAELGASADNLFAPYTRLGGQTP
ncbi:MAG: hypothetical protein ACXVYI_00535 [Mycobacterium sp.]